MNPNEGRKLRKAILNDEFLAEKATVSPNIVETDQKRDEVYYSEEETLDVSGLGHYVDTVGDVFYGAQIEVPDDADLDTISNHLSKLACETLEDVTAPLVWAESRFNKYIVYIECEELLREAVEAHGDLRYNQEPEDLYRLRFDKAVGDPIVFGK